LPGLLCAIRVAAEHTPRRLETAHLEAVHQARLEFIKKRAILPQLGVYCDLRAAWCPNAADRERVQHAAKVEGIQVLLLPDGEPQTRDGVLWMAAPPGDRFPEHAAEPAIAEFAKQALDDPKQARRLAAVWNAYPQEFYAEAADAWPEFLTRWESSHHKTSFDPYEVSLRHASLHILARDFTEPEIRASLRDSHVYSAHEWLCDPAGFSFVAANNLGVFDIGDPVPAAGPTHFEARLPVAAKMKLFLGDKVVAETTGLSATFAAEDVGDYHLEASLAADREDRLWIRTAPMHLFRPGPAMLQLPPAGFGPEVEVVRNLTYTSGTPELDLYLPRGAKNFPVLLFVHGGLWRTRDRALYAGLGNRFAQEGIGVAIPSYRLAPENPPPAQMEDVAAAFAWVVKHIADYGGDSARIYVALGRRTAGGVIGSGWEIPGRSRSVAREHQRRRCVERRVRRPVDAIV
jgi:hypothetical protein